MSRAKLLCLAAIVLLSMTAFYGLPVPAAANSNYSEDVTIMCRQNDASVTGAVMSIFRLEGGIPAERVAQIQTGNTASVSLKLPAGEYSADAYIAGESGYHGQGKFSVDPKSGGFARAVAIEMKPNSDHGKVIDLTPTAANMKPSKQDVTMVSAVSAVQGKGGKEDVPLFIDNDVLRNREKYSPVDPMQLDPATRAVAIELLKKVQSQANGTYFKPLSPTTTNTIGTQNVGDWIWIPPFMVFGIVATEQLNRVWHPIAVVDSEAGLTHTLGLKMYFGDTVTISSEIKAQGASVGGSVETQNTFTIEYQDVTSTNGYVQTVRFEYGHLYQEGIVVIVSPPFIIPIGTFQREWVKEWYPMSFETPSGAQYVETRANYIGTWTQSTEARVGMTTQTSWTGSLGFSVSKGDVFGASATFSVTITYGAEAHHYFKWVRPSSYYKLEFYAGNFFDINSKLIYTGGGGGGCPILYTYTESGYVEEGLLDIHNGYAGSDLKTTHALTYVPNVVNHRYLMRLIEHPATMSHIDQVKLFAILVDGRTVELPLISAVHSEKGKVSAQLLLIDGWRVDELGADWNNGVSQSIDLEFAATQLGQIAGFAFVIVGYNVIVK